jgi:hypothetical protein
VEAVLAAEPIWNFRSVLRCPGRGAPSGICPAIPYRSNTKDMPAFIPKTLYKARARIEQAVGKLKRFKRIAL